MSAWDVVVAGAAHRDRPRILCVDDDKALLDGMRRQLHMEFDVHCATSGEQGLMVLKESGPFAVVVSDMRMPGMNGADLLSRAREAVPDTTRVLLTGYADVDSAMAAINRGNIFRFLLKPCSREDMLAALTAAYDQYRLITAEREFFEQTLRGAVNALCETLALANPPAFARATRVRQLVADIAVLAGVPNPWTVEVAATLSQIGAVVLPPQVVAKLHDGIALSPDEQDLVDDLPRIADRVLAGIPRLEAVRQVIRLECCDYGEPLEGSGLHPGPKVPIGARLLRLALDLDTLEAGGLSRSNAIEVLKSRRGVYDPALLSALGRLDGHAGATSTVSAVTSFQLRPGMVIARDVADGAGRLLVGRGYKVTQSLIERISNWRHTTGIIEPVYVLDDVGHGSEEVNPPRA